MSTRELKETAGFNRCHACGTEGSERDKFCRRCGVVQGLGTAPLISVAGETAPLDCETRSLPRVESHCCSFSGALASVVTQGVSARTSPLGDKRWAMRLVGALIAVPLWLMIVLLSPVDAYLAARAIARQA